MKKIPLLMIGLSLSISAMAADGSENACGDQSISLYCEALHEVPAVNPNLAEPKEVVVVTKESRFENVKVDPNEPESDLCAAIIRIADEKAGISFMATLLDDMTFYTNSARTGHGSQPQTMAKTAPGLPISTYFTFDRKDLASATYTCVVR